MNTSLQLFQYQDQNVRTILVDGEKMFVAKDVAVVLGYVDTKKAIKQHCRGEAKHLPILDSLGRTQQARIVAISDVLRLIVHSKLPDSEKFERWVFEEVMPTVVQTGSYGTPVAMDLKAITRRQLAEAIIEEANRADAAEQQLAIVAPKIEAFDTFMKEGDDMDVRDAAQLLNNRYDIKIGQNRLFDWLYDNGWTDKDDRAIQSKLDQKLLVMKHRNFTYTRSDGSKGKAKPQVRITPKGLAKILKIMTEPEAPRRKLRSLNP